MAREIHCPIGNKRLFSPLCSQRSKFFFGGKKKGNERERMCQPGRDGGAFISFPSRCIDISRLFDSGPDIARPRQRRKKKEEEEEKCSRFPSGSALGSRLLARFPRSLNSVKRSEEMSLTAKRPSHSLSRFLVPPAPARLSFPDDDDEAHLLLFFFTF